MSPDKEKRLLELAGQLCDETLSGDGFAELEAMLNSDLQARALYRSFTGMHRQLEDGALQPEAGAPFTTIPFRQKPLLGWLVASAAAMIALLAVFSGPGGTPTPNPPTAVLTRAIDVEWEHHSRFQAKVGEPITEQWLRIASGLAEIEFSSGAVVSIEGPARLRIDNPLYCFYRSGKLTANCPESAHGFTIRFPGGKVIDLGTEFAMDSAPDGKTNVHVMTGEVIVALTDESETVISEQNLLENSAVEIDPANSRIETIDFDAEPFASMQRASLIQSAPIKLQFDIGHRAGVYTGTNSPGHAASDFYAHENVWTQIVGDQAGTFVMADGNICPFPLKVDYGHGDGEIDWDAKPVDPWGRVYSKARGVFDSALCQDHLPWDFDLGLRVSGLPAGTYRVYALCRSVRRVGASYDVSFGANLDQQLPEPTVIPPLDDSIEPSWDPGLTYAVGDVVVSGPEDWATFITRYSRERSLQSTSGHGRSVLLGLQIVEIRPSN
ncbi:MAG: hypothetical protein P1U86_22435 [Verrucomicrobiales bacterium]|nr:hypothetical protein [Verrucomicrobiales bacterium]